MNNEPFNKSGIIPIGARVLVKLEKPKEKTKGGIIIPQDTLDKEGEASQIAQVIDMGKAAFTNGVGDLPLEFAIKPVIGSYIIMERYAGVRIEGLDNEEYRLLSDKQVLSILNK